MKSKKLARALLIAAFCLVTQAAVFGSGSRQQQAAGVETLELYGGGVSGIWEGRFFTEIWKEQLGIVFNSIPTNPDVLNTIIASGNLPDILQIQQYGIQDTLIRAGQLLNLDDYKDKLPNLYNNPEYENSFRYRRDVVSAGTGGMYSLGTDHTKTPGTVGNENLGPHLRWDYYKELGMPVLNEPEDYLPLLKQMVDAHPVNEAGQRVYGISLFSDWGGVSGFMDISFTGGGFQLGHLEIDVVKNTTRSVLDNDSVYKRMLQILFNANQMGILDPDSITQGYSDMLTKAKAGRVLFSPWPWGTPGQFRTVEREAAGIGYKLVPFTNEKVYSSSYTAPQYIGSEWSYVISKNTKHLDKALAFIDFMGSYDGCWLMYNGPRGDKWDLDENGEPYLTPLGWQLNTNATQSFPTGGTQSESGGLYFGLNRRAVHPVYGRQINNADWIKKDFAPQDSALLVDWQKTMNARDDIDYFTKNNMLVLRPFAQVDPTPDNIMIIQNRVNEVVVPLSWQMVYAKDQAEFDRLWTEMVEQAKGRNIDTEVQWYREAYTQAKTNGAKYMQ